MTRSESRPQELASCGSGTLAPTFDRACAELARLERREAARLLRGAASLRVLATSFAGRYALLDVPPFAPAVLRACVREHLDGAPWAGGAVRERMAYPLLQRCAQGSPRDWPETSELARAAVALHPGDRSYLCRIGSLCAEGLAERALDELEAWRAPGAAGRMEGALRAVEAIACAESGRRGLALAHTARLCDRSQLVSPFWVWALHFAHSSGAEHLRERVARRADEIWTASLAWRPLLERCARAVAPWAPVTGRNRFRDPSSRWMAHWRAASA